MQRLAILLLCMLWLSACSDDTASKPAETSDAGSGGDSCRSNCEQNLWPRLVVGVAQGLMVRNATATNESEEVIPGLSGGCPQEFGHPCSFSWITGPSTKRLLIHIELSGGNAYETSVMLRAHNYCGRDIAYLEFVNDGESPAFRAPEYLSPCAGVVDKDDPRSD